MLAEHTDALEDLAQSTPVGAGAQSGPERHSAPAGQETAELDMRAVLEAEHPAPATVSSEDSLEWEVAGDSLPESRARAQASDPAGAADAAEEPVEDVLEETPDFLRDTPDQERLWFEQQPPRDFDFDQ